MALQTGSADDSGWFRQTREDDRIVLRFGGRWTLEAVGRHDQELRRLTVADSGAARIDISALDKLDTAGAWAICRAVAALQKPGREVDLIGAQPAHAALIERVRACEAAPHSGRRFANPVLVMLERIGGRMVMFLEETRDLVGFLGQTVFTVVHSVLRPSRIRLTPLVSHLEQVGLNAVPIVGLLSFLIGVVLAYQGADQLRRFGADIFTVNLLAVSVLREIGILITAIIVAGRSGSAFAAQIGTMKVNQEVDAMRTLGLDPIEILVLPRVVALVLAMPLLAFFADMMGLLGGGVICYLMLDISISQFLRQLNGAVSLWSFWIGIIKAPIFGFIIALVGCFAGLSVSGSAESVGRLTTKAVVESIFIVIVVDAIFSVLFSYLKI
ncbi:MAG: MlaE family lipid ABC transporter permease subunit [Alphaproteobacteria bacterium]|nr:MlaE family lipid ABC transporter permease subunit [Alphaproteobacteria bacterium]